MESPTSPDQIIHDLGGCGRYQIRMNVIVHVIKTVICWSASAMVIVSATPKWWCADDEVLNELNVTSCVSSINGSEVIACPVKSCFAANETKCSKFAFAPGMNTIVSEVCVSLSYSYSMPRQVFNRKTSAISMTMAEMTELLRLTTYVLSNFYIHDITLYRV